MRNRTLSRQIALQFLYMHAVHGQDAAEQLDNFLLRSSEKNEVRAFARRLIEGSLENLENLDQQISEVADNWRLERMAIVDLSILRLAAYELLMLDDVPPIVSINEAIELAKSFSTEKSSAFVNGIIDKINNKISKVKQKKPKIPAE